MAYSFQVTQDSNTPHSLADWWAETLGWTVEPQDEAFIRRMIAEGHASEDDTLVHNGSLAWRAGAAINHPDRSAAAPRVLFQWVPEPRAGKNRMHLDVRVGEHDKEAVVAKLTARGATELHRGRQGPLEWVTMADPEGNEFCVS